MSPWVSAGGSTGEFREGLNSRPVAYHLDGNCVPMTIKGEPFETTETSPVGGTPIELVPGADHPTANGLFSPTKAPSPSRLAPGRPVPHGCRNFASIRMSPSSSPRSRHGLEDQAFLGTRRRKDPERIRGGSSPRRGGRSEHPTPILGSPPPSECALNSDGPGSSPAPP